MSKKILCPFHKEDTPSCVLYADGFKCFGCGAHGALEELEGVELPPREELEPEPPEDLAKAYDYINALPKTLQRGLFLPTDDHSYFVTWPNETYYKRRFKNPGDGPKYVGARGHKRPLFWARQEGHKVLALVEGEINALSVARAFDNIDVVSPGGVGDFSEKKLSKWLTRYYRYSTILILADADKPGAEAIINALAVCWASKIQAIGIPMARDANDLLVGSGVGKLREEIKARSKGALD